MSTVSAPRVSRQPATGSASYAKKDAATRTAAGVALWLGLLLVSYWWVTGGGVRDLAGWQSGLTSVGRLTGLVAADLLLVQVLLMARIPLLERAFGRDRLVRVHRLTGLTSFNLMVAHIVLITWGYATGDLIATPGEFWDLTTNYPGMLLAVAGTACLVMVVVTSVKAARRRLRYESWHLLHLYGYLGAGLALPHQLWTGQDFTGSTARTVYWWSLWGLAAAAVLGLRVVVPLWHNARHQLRVTSVVAESNDTVSVYVTGRDVHRLRADAGQFFGWRFLDGPGWTRANPYSLSAAPDGRSLRITVKEAGDGSARLRSLKPGTRAFVEGPFGRLSGRARTRRRVALIGAGVGMAPLRALAEGLDYAPGEAVLLQRFTDRPLYERELGVLARERGLQVGWLPGHRRTADSWLPAGAGFADDVAALRWWVPDVAGRDVYICGPEEWTESVRRAALAAGVPDENLHIEYFEW
ncbi:MAG TPA: ferredoxin reductase family protein [Kribbellaceae bacterium]|nr:ferredoxin reductase family protein [Kribbellaceae bacterium]